MGARPHQNFCGKQGRFLFVAIAAVKPSAYIPRSLPEYMVTPRALFLGLTLMLFLAVGVRGQDGIYADFVTNYGNFTCQLNYDKAPRTVASFIGLASGEKAWLRLATGEVVRRPFYDGLTFHRVVSGFVIQGGSPAGKSSDGPGYRFRDEFDPTLRHDSAGILSMANSGGNSNGSQFFITLAATPHLDDVHSVFGKVTSGMNVVNAIGVVPVDSNSRPIVPVIMHSVTIRRVGAAAQSFDWAAQDLPLVGGAGPQLYKQGTSLFLSVPWALRSEYYFYSSANLAAWTGQRLGYTGSQLPTSDLDVTMVAGTSTRQFYRVPHIQYPPLVEPQSLAGGRMVINRGGGQTLTIDFNSSGGGTWVQNSPALSGSVTSYFWTREFNLLISRLACNFDAHAPLEIFPTFSSATAGAYTGRIFTTSTGTAISGTFAYTPPTSPSLLLSRSSSSEVITSADAVSAMSQTTEPRKRNRSTRKRYRVR